MDQRCNSISQHMSTQSFKQKTKTKSYLKPKEKLKVKQNRQFFSTKCRKVGTGRDLRYSGPRTGELKAKTNRLKLKVKQNRQFFPPLNVERSALADLQYSDPRQSFSSSKGSKSATRVDPRSTPSPKPQAAGSVWTMSGKCHLLPMWNPRNVTWVIRSPHSRATVTMRQLITLTHSQICNSHYL